MTVAVGIGRGRGIGWASLVAAMLATRVGAASVDFPAPPVPVEASWPDGRRPPIAAELTPATVTSSSGTSPVSLPFLWGLWVYRNVVSPVDGARCGSYPTCSAFATHAVRRRGPLIGGMLAADRLIHEGSARPPEFPFVERFGRKRIWDPVEANDAWMGPAKYTFEPPPERSRPDGAALATWLEVTELRRIAFRTTDGAVAADALSEAGWISMRVARETKERAPADAREPGRAGFEEADRLFEEAEKRAIDAADLSRARRAAYGRAFAHLARDYRYEARRRFDLLASEAGGAASAEDRALLADAEWLSAWAAFSAELADGARPREAVRVFEELAAAGEHPRAPDVRALVEEAGNARLGARSPGVALGMSLVLPGSGFVYAGKPLLGAGSFVLNAAFVGGIVWAIHERNYPLAVALFSLETGWYLGGAGGAAEAALHRTRDRRARFERGLRRRYLGGVWPGGAGAAILF